MRYGYGRVSSTTRYAGGEDGNSLEAQDKKLRAAGCDEIILEAYTGTKMDRPKFTKLIAKLVSGDTLVVCKLDRFARTATEGVELIKELMGRGVSVHVLNMGLVEDSPTGRLTLTIMMAFAEYERDMIIERLNDGKEEAKAKNPDYKEGRKAIEIPLEFEGCRNYVAEGNMTVVEACKYLGISRSLWYKWMKQVA
ncbi:MAG: recombinase family protein [Clostridia bacterium]|nr:recombinase family protein [Clostridia bacterium]